MYLPFLLNSYQVESRVTGKPAEQEFLQRQEDLLLENYSSYKYITFYDFVIYMILKIVSN